VVTVLTGQIMAQIQFTPTWISKVPFTTKRKHYTDSHPRSKFGNCDLVLVVGGRTKTGYLRFRKYINGKRRDQLIKLADMTSNAISLSELRDIYETKVIEIKRNESPVLVAKSFQTFTLGDAIDFYLERKNPSDIGQLLNIKEDLVGARKAGDLILMDLSTSQVKELVEPLVQKGSLYSANMKREFIQRVWNYCLREHDEIKKLIARFANPATFDMKLYCQFEKKASTKSLSLEEYAEFFDIVSTCKREDIRDLFHMFLYLGQHPFSEIARMRWDQLQEIDGQWWWFMEEGFHKTSKRHTIPLHPIVMDIINKYKEFDETYVFPNPLKGKEFYNAHDFKYYMKEFRRKYQIEWDVRCLRAAFITTIEESNMTFRAGILCNQAAQNITEKNYLGRGKIPFKDFKIEMINAYMEIIKGVKNGI